VISFNEIKVKANIKEGKKPKYDKVVCPDLLSQSRCRKCCFWLKLKKIDLTNGKQLMKVGCKIPKENLKSMYIVRLSGCAVLTEVCPHCIVDVRNERASKLIGIYDKECINERLSCNPAFAYPHGNKKHIFYCKICNKNFHHSELKHLVHIMQIMEVECAFKQENDRRKTKKKKKRRALKACAEVW